MVGAPHDRRCGRSHTFEADPSVRLTEYGAGGIGARGPELKILQQIDRKLKVVERLKVRVITVLDQSYPVQLRTIPLRPHRGV